MTAIASKSQHRMSFLRYALVTVPLVLMLGMLSGAVANSGYGNPWFDALEKPEFMPPGWMFGAAWTLLYILLGLVLAIILHARGARNRGALILLFGLQLISNYLWSPLFFGWHRIFWSLVLILDMIALTVLLMALLWNVRRRAALLLLPYLAWLCFAGALNYRIMQLNPERAELVPQRGSTNIRL